MHHSPSSLSTAANCERKWWYDHVERRREPDVTWAQIEAAGADWQKIATPRQRSAARGTDVHAILEEYYRGGSPNWSTPNGQIAMAARAHLPARELCREVRIERSIGDTPYPSADEPDRTCLMVDGIRLLGYIDLEARLDPSGAEVLRLGLDSSALRMSGGWVTIDYKTSKSVERYALTPEKAAEDPQGIIYSVDGMLRPGFPVGLRPVRWVYTQTEGRPFAKPVDVVFEYVQARRHLDVLVSRARNLESKTTVDQCTTNTSHCGEYGGCPHHTSKGGPCTARQAVGKRAIMGFQDAYNKAQAEKRGLTVEAYLAAKAAGTLSAGAVAAATPPAQTTEAPAKTREPKPKFGKKTAPAPEENRETIMAQEPVAAPPPAPESAGANGPAEPAPAVVEMTGTPKRSKAHTYTDAGVPIHLLVSSLLERVRVDLAGGDVEKARNILSAIIG